mmetsp:Transcript_25989/g.72579  ORF Transcript_25989/g.72579 Transcript_25989/m.72579 type:complete len:211 (+) Transcript_25989:287-919(+)
MHVGRGVIHEFLFLLLAIIHQAAVLCQPHVALEPVFRLHTIAFALHLPQSASEGRLKLVRLGVVDLAPPVCHCHLERAEGGGHVLIQVERHHHARPGLMNLIQPKIEVFLSLAREQRYNLIFHVSVLFHLEGELKGGAFHVGDLALTDVVSAQKHEAPVLFLAEVAERPIGTDPHVALKPMCLILHVPVVVQLPKRALVPRRVRRVLDPP